MVKCLHRTKTESVPRVSVKESEVAVHTCKPNFREIKTRGFPRLAGQPSFLGNVQNSERPCPKKKKF